MKSSLRFPAIVVVLAAIVAGAVLVPRWLNADGPPQQQAVSQTEPAKPLPQPTEPAATGTIPRPAPAVDTSPAQPAAQAVPQSRESVKLSFAPVVKRVAPAVVNVYATSRVEVRSPFAGDPFFERFFGPGSPFGSRQRERSSLGSGVIVDKSGVIVTNNHVVGDATEIKVALSDGREFPAKVLLKDERTDIAVLKIDDDGKPFPVLQIGDSDALEVGDLVLAVGDPFGVGQTVTSGIVSALARTNIGINDAGFFIQTDAAINPGNSGGALVDVDGKLVGINSAIYSRSGGSIGIGFAIPSAMVRTVLAPALAGSKQVARAWIGVLSQDVTQDIADSLGLAAPHGALVTHVDADSPGAKAGLKVGDLILKAGKRDVGDAASFDYRLAIAGIGKRIDLSVWRDGKTLDVNVVPEAEPQLSKKDLTTLQGHSPLSGAVVTDLTATLVDRMRIRGADHGVVIVNIEPGSPAAHTGFRPGDVILGAQGEDVSDAKQLADMVESGSRFWRISFNRGGRVSNVVIGG